MQLQQVNAIGLEVAEADFDALPQIIFREPFFDVVVRRRRPFSRIFGRDFRCHVNVFAPVRLQEFADDPFAVSVAVALGGVDEIAAEVQCLLQGGHGIFVALPAPGLSAERPGAEANFGNLPAEFAKRAIFHLPTMMGCVG